MSRFWLAAWGVLSGYLAGLNEVALDEHVPVEESASLPDPDVVPDPDGDGGPPRDVPVSGSATLRAEDSLQMKITRPPSDPS